jgi:hypothetical protein
MSDLVARGGFLENCGVGQINYVNPNLFRFVKSSREKYFSSVFRKIMFLSPRPASFEEGRTRRHDREAGCDGCHGAARRAAIMHAAKACGSGAPGLVLSLQ